MTLAPVGAGSDIVPTVVCPLTEELNAARAMPGAKTSTAAAARTAATRPDAGVRPASAVLRLLRKVSGFLSGLVVRSILTAFMR